MHMTDYFSLRKVIIATQHKKEEVMAPLLTQELGLDCIVSATTNTDQFGTFTGEIKRMDDDITTARKKCLMALELCNCDMAIASEGSFGPHPALPFMPADTELILLLDIKNNFEIFCRHISANTNFRGEQINQETELMAFANQVLFPSHALILRPSKDIYTECYKGIKNESELKTLFNYLRQRYGSVYVETDMRAMHNPTRMKVIEAATQKLIEKIKSLCPICKTPGFSIQTMLPGLQCALCGAETNSIREHHYNCVKCQHKKIVPYPNNKFHEDPMFCNQCNP